MLIEELAAKRRRVYIDKETGLEAGPHVLHTAAPRDVKSAPVHAIKWSEAPKHIRDHVAANGYPKIRRQVREHKAKGHDYYILSNQDLSNHKPGDPIDHAWPIHGAAFKKTHTPTKIKGQYIKNPKYRPKFFIAHKKMKVVNHLEKSVRHVKQGDRVMVGPMGEMYPPGDDGDDYNAIFDKKYRILKKPPIKRRMTPKVKKHLRRVTKPKPKPVAPVVEQHFQPFPVYPSDETAKMIQQRRRNEEMPTVQVIHKKMLHRTPSTVEMIGGLAATEDPVEMAVKIAQCRTDIKTELHQGLHRGKNRDELAQIILDRARSMTAKEPPTIPTAEVSKKLLDKPTLSPKALAKKHKVPIDRIHEQLAMGIKVESEHTSDKKLAREIALDHLAEKPDYYTRLKKVEASMENKGMKKSAIRKLQELAGNLPLTPEQSQALGQISQAYRDQTQFMSPEVAALTAALKNKNLEAFGAAWASLAGSVFANSMERIRRDEERQKANQANVPQAVASETASKKGKAKKAKK